MRTDVLMQQGIGLGRAGAASALASGGKGAAAYRSAATGVPKSCRIRACPSGPQHGVPVTA